MRVAAALCWYLVAMDASKFANRPTDLHPLIRMRYSPRAYGPEPISKDVVRRIFEAGQWSSSCFNGQPWRFVIAVREDSEAFARILSTLMPLNQAWAGRAGLLGIAVAKSTFDHNGQPNRFSAYDTGQAMAQIALQAEAEGLHVHQMGGFDAAKAREVLGIPEGYEPQAAFTLGVEGDPALLNDDQRAKELAPGARKAYDEIVFSGAWPK